MIHFNVKRKESNDPYGIAKMAYDALEEKLKGMVTTTLSRYDLSKYNVVVDIDLENSKMNITSSDMPESLVQEIQQSLSEMGNL